MFINDQKAFDHWLLEFNPNFYVGIDTEFVRKDTFFPILCLFQISSTEETVVIDPLKVDIKPLLNKLNEPKNLLKIFFSGRQDMEALFYQYDIMLFPIFDLQIAAEFLSYKDSVSLAMLIEEICYKTIDKEHQKLDWSKRPLSDSAIEYAYNDSHFLIAIYKTFKKKLKACDKYSWVLEESCKIINQITDLGSDYFKKNFFNPKAHHLSFKRELVLWREQYARFKNIPRRRVYTDAFIHNIKPSYIDWTCFIPKEGWFFLTQKETFIYQKKMKDMAKTAKHHNIPKRYFYYPFELIKWIRSPLEPNIFLEGWRDIILSQTKD